MEKEYQYDSLVFEEVIIEAHDDYSLWGSVVAGFDDSKRLLVVFECINYDESEKYAIIASLDMDNALRLSRRMGVPLTGIPKELYEMYGDDSNMSRCSEVKSVFDRILDYIGSTGARFKVRHTARKKER